MTIFGVKSNASSREKLPTIRQFVKSTTKSKYKSDGIVELVWLPGKFNNYTLQTDSFRIILPEVHKLYDSLSAFFGGLNERSCGIRVEISNWRTAEFILHELSEDSGYWEFFGNNGVRWRE